ncbi:uncharacterized protein ATNIH1004_003397 [Aspergillus tanneri]|uniref:Uncharacterized protein n=1 Tax=Aspergillus tanneri TaxID=1220188 RepID=A0A5M9N181_9EURO|nr:uncharacterized protein ATNIH1004_003397 [Aspergillus tanneri]KAA8650709.1 hypothetical protein ATNIH1004_003397 [Aspergillus tanneri]
MREPEMTHSPTYYQDHGQLMTTYHHDSTPAAPHAAHIPPFSSTDPRPKQGVSGYPPSELNPVEDAISSDSWDTSYGQHPQELHSLPHRYQQQAPVESIYSDPDPSAVAPVTNGTTRKEERVRGSWTDHSSYMSGENNHHSATRAHKRPIHQEEPSTDDSQDALLMLLCDLLVPQLHIHERLVCLRASSSFRSASTQSIYNNNDADRSSGSNSCESYSVGGLVAVLILSSFLSVAFLLLVWTAAFFWVFAMVLGNPDGTERKDDGRAAVLGVCKWWHMWLCKARKPTF